MRNRKVSYLLIILVFSIIFGIKLIGHTKSQPITTPVNLPELIRSGYELVNDSSAFSKLCMSLNDSLLSQTNNLKIAVFTDINSLDSTISWCLLRYADEYEQPKVSDRYFFYIDLYKEGNIKAQNSPTLLSNIHSLVVNYIFHPDSISKKRIFTKRNINTKEEMEVSDAGVYMKIHIKDNNGYSVSDWRFFYNCLSELVKLFEDERNKISLKIWDRDYDLLSFQEKIKIVDLVGYRINIEFK